MRAIGGRGGILALSKPSGRRHMSRFTGSAQTAIDYNSTIIAALELSSKKWVLAVQLPGVDRHSRHVLDACGDGLVSFVARLKARCAAAAVSDQTLAARLPVVSSGHEQPIEQPVPISQQLAGGHPSGCDDVREIPAVAAQR